MQLTTSAAFANTITPYASAARPGGSAVPGDQYTPSFPPIDHPASLGYAHHRTAHQPPVYVPDLPGKPASKEPGRPGSDGVEAAPGDDSSVSGEDSSRQDVKHAEVSVGNGQSGVAGQLSEAELDEILQLAKRDREVRHHEQTHAAVGGPYAGAPSYSFRRGPDGLSYAVAGEVPIDVAPVPGDPQATIRKMQQVQRAALAPAEPSGQDRAVAALAARQLMQAQAEQAAVRSAGLAPVAAVSDGAGQSPESVTGEAEAEAEISRPPAFDAQAVRGLQLYRDLFLQGEAIREQGLWTRPLLDVIA